MAEKIGPPEFAALMNRFYGAATGVLVPRHAVVDKMIGDEVMAFYAPALVENMRSTAVDAAVALLNAVGYGSADGPWVEVGIGINFGPAYVGKVGTGDVTTSRRSGTRSIRRRGCKAMPQAGRSS